MSASTNTSKNSSYVNLQFPMVRKKNINYSALRSLNYVRLLWSTCDKYNVVIFFHNETVSSCLQTLPPVTSYPGAERCASARSHDSIDSIHSVHSEYTDQVSCLSILFTVHNKPISFVKY